MKKLRITVGQKTYDVTVEVLSDEAPQRAVSGPAAMGAAISAPRAAAPAAPKGPAAAGAVTSPMAGVVKTVLVKAGDAVAKGQALIILEAMKMDNHVIAPDAATVESVNVAEGDSVQEGHVLVVLN